MEVDGEKPTGVYEDEPTIEESLVCLDWYDSDATLKIDKSNMMSAEPFYRGAWSYVWSGGRGSYGYLKGKVCYEVKIVEAMKSKNSEFNDFRVGWSTNNSDLLLGRGSSSFAYCGKSGKKCLNNTMEDYGETYEKGDVIGVFLEFNEDKFIVKFSKNGKSQGVAFELPKSQLQSLPLFPHISTRNYKFEVNFGMTIVSETDGKQKSPKYTIKAGGSKKDPWFQSTTEDYDFVANTEGVKNVSRIAKREDCEMTMMIGLPASGKTTWVNQYLTDNPSKRINVIGLSSLMDRMEYNNQPIRKHMGDKEFERVVPALYECLKMWITLACRRHRNVMIDQTNVYPITKDKGKVHEFRGMKRTAVVLVPADEDYISRIDTQKKVGDSAKDRYVSSEDAIMEMKAIFKLPEEGNESPFSEIKFVGLKRDEAASLLEKYREEAKKKGFPKRDNKNFSKGRNTRDVGGKRGRSHWDNKRNEGDFGRGRRGFDFSNDYRRLQQERAMMSMNGLSSFNQRYPLNMNGRFTNPMEMTEQNMMQRGIRSERQGMNNELNQFAFQNGMALSGSSRSWNNLSDRNNMANTMNSMSMSRDQISPLLNMNNSSRNVTRDQISQLLETNRSGFEQSSTQRSNGAPKGFGFLLNNNPWNQYESSHYTNYMK